MERRQTVSKLVPFFFRSRGYQHRSMLVDLYICIANSALKLQGCQRTRKIESLAVGSAVSPSAVRFQSLSIAAPIWPVTSFCSMLMTAHPAENLTWKLYVVRVQ